jgi:hypothetical protein
MAFEIATWYDTWNSTGLANLLQRKVPLGYATRYNLAFGQFVPAAGANGYTLAMNGAYATQVLAQIRQQAPGVQIFGSSDPGGTNLSATVEDNRRNGNRSTRNIVAYLQQQGLNGISIDAEESGLSDVPTLVSQLGPSFKAAGLGIAVSAPWPGSGPMPLYGEGAVEAFNQFVDAIELQDYSAAGTPQDVAAWIAAGVRNDILMGGVCTENSDVQTSLEDTVRWTQVALQSRIRGMFSWRLDNDHGRNGQEEDVNPTFTGAKAIYDTVHGTATKAAGS